MTASVGSVTDSEKEHGVRRMNWQKLSVRAALALMALLLTGCGGGATVGASTTPVAAQQTAEAAQLAAAQATRAAQSTADSRVDATLVPQLTATAQRQATSSGAAPPTATSIPVSAQPLATPTATPETAASAASTAAAYTADFPHWPIATPGGPDPASEHYDAATSAYRIALTAADHAYVHWQYAPEGRAYGDFTLDIDGQGMSGPLGGSWGVLFRAQPQRAGDKTNARYDLIVTPSKQQVSVNWTSANGQAKVLALATVPALHTGTALNHLHLTAQGDRVTVAVNGQAVGSATGPSTTPGAIGLIVLQPSQPAGSSGMDVAFSHLVVALLSAQ
jgi:hypothetical protein